MDGIRIYDQKCHNQLYTIYNARLGFLVKTSVFYDLTSQTKVSDQIKSN